MPKVQVRTVDRAAQCASSGSASGGTALDYFAGNAPLHLRVQHLEAASSIAIEAGDHDTIAYVWKGEVVSSDRPLEADSCVIVRRGGKAEVTAAGAGATLLLFASRDETSAAADDALVYLLPSHRVPRRPSLRGTPVKGALYADSLSVGTSLWLHQNEFPADFEVGLHSHSEDEIIFVTAGSIILGRRDYGPGTALAIGADTIYGFHAGESGLTFVNFRANSPTITHANSEHSTDEGAFWRGATGIPLYIQHQQARMA